MATASGSSEGRHKPIMPVVAYGVVLALLVAAGVIVFAAGGGKGKVPAGDGAARAAPPAAVDASTARALKLPPRPSPPEKAAPERAVSETAAAPAKPEPVVAPAPAVSPAQAEPQKKPEPPKTECKVDLTRWPTEKSDQAQAVQMMLRDLGYYRGTTNGTVGPQTRTAIREFQGATAEGDAGEVSEALFEALKKKCAASP
jgi:hypothetical protein